MDNSNFGKIKLNKIKENTDIIVFLVILPIIFLLLLKKCVYGFSVIDECLYIEIPLRFVQGDAPFVDEWHIAQISQMLLYPVLKLYFKFHDNTDGIVLAFRYIYLFVNTLSSVFVYFLLRKHSKIGSLLVFVLLSIYAPFGIMALSYNTMGIIFLTLCFSILSRVNKKDNWYILSGILYALSVLCCPFNCLLLIFYIVFVIVNKKTKYNFDVSFLTPKRLLKFILGILIPFVLFCIFVFSRETIGEFVSSLSKVLDDPQHKDILPKIPMYFFEILTENPFLTVLYIFYGALIVIGVKNSKMKIKVWGLLIFVCLLCIDFLVLFLKDSLINEYVFPLNFLALYCVLVFKEKSVKNVFYTIWIPGMLYTYCISLSSDLGIFAISSAGIVPLTGSIIIIIETIAALIRNHDVNKWLVIAGISILILVQLSSVIYLRYSYVFGDLEEGRHISEQKVYVDEGIDKGLYVAQCNMPEYEKYMDDLSKIDGDKKVLFVTPHFWAYLFDSWECCGYSAWTYGADKPEYIERERYYLLTHPDKKPECIYIDYMFFYRFKDFLEYGDYDVELTDNNNIIMTLKE